MLGLADKEVTINNNFFHISGDSISAIKLVGKAQRISFQLTITDIFNKPILATLATVITTKVHNKSPKESQQEGKLTQRISQELNINFNCIKNIYPATPLQRGLITLTTQIQKSNTLQHVYHLAAGVNLDHLRSA